MSREVYLDNKFYWDKDLTCWVPTLPSGDFNDDEQCMINVWIEEYGNYAIAKEIYDVVYSVTTKYNTWNGTTLVELHWSNEVIKRISEYIFTQGFVKGLSCHNVDISTEFQSHKDPSIPSKTARVLVKYKDKVLQMSIEV